jgi:MFS family permease
MENPTSAFKRNIVLLGFVSLLTDWSSQMIFPVLPFFLTQSLGASPTAVGVIEGLAETISALLKRFSGVWSDGIRARKSLVWGGYTLSTLSKLLFIPALTWPLVLIARSIERVGKGIRSAPRDALLADSITDGKFGRAFGIQRSMDAVGGVLGGLTAWALIPYADFRQIILYSIIPAVLGSQLVLLVREPSIALKPENAKKISGAEPLSGAAKRAVAACALFAAGKISIALMLLRAPDLHLTTRDALLVYAGYQLLYALLSPALGRAVDRFGKPALARFSTITLLISLALLAFGQSASWLIGSFLFYGLAEASSDVGQRAWMIDLAGASQRGSVLGAYYAAIAVTALPAGFLLGWLWTNWHAVAACAAAAVLVTASGFLMPQIANSRQPTS